MGPSRGRWSSKIGSIGIQHPFPSNNLLESQEKAVYLLHEDATGAVILVGFRTSFVIISRTLLREILQAL
ncbi:MAG: hypothetical protein D6795_17700 [Deltaproteobacteria bacterium]|nr:MAG: hypothetical protein D6795_17700 [Deltaproteobacteria bacterium]